MVFGLRNYQLIKIIMDNNENTTPEEVKKEGEMPEVPTTDAPATDAPEETPAM